METAEIQASFGGVGARSGFYGILGTVYDCVHQIRLFRFMSVGYHLDSL
jgi:hypothetical protein